MLPLTAILPWNNRELFGKGWQNQHTVCRLSPRFSGSFGSAVCSEHQRPIRDVSLKGAQFNQTFGRLCVQGREPLSQRNQLLRKTMGRHHPRWSRETLNLCTCACSPPFFIDRNLHWDTFWNATKNIVGCTLKRKNPVIYMCIIDHCNSWYPLGMIL